MERRKFNSLWHYNNEKWAANALGMTVNFSKGPDLTDDKKVVEVKFNLLKPGAYSHKSWRVLGYQKEYDQLGKKAYWALGTYSLDRPISEIRTSSQEKLEQMVGERKLWLVKWDWMNQFPPYWESGKTKLSEWGHYLIFPKARLLPKVVKTHKVTGGEILFTEGVESKQFLNNHP